MDHVEEQEMELEALRSIYHEEDMHPCEAPKWNEVGCGKEWTVVLRPCDVGEEEPTDVPVRVGLTFAHTPKYPEELPRWRIHAMRGVGEEDLEGMREEMRLEAESNLGMSMIFAMASVGQEWLRRRYQGDSYEACDVEDGYGSDDDGNKRSMDAEEEKRMEARSHGQMVDATTFQAWKEKYEAEAALERAMSMDVRLESEKKKRMTGRMFFESGGFSMDDEEQDLQEEYDVEDADLDELDEEELAYLEEEVSERLHLQG